MVANLVDSSTGATVNLAQDIMLHHFVLINRDNPDTVCPGGIQGGLGERFFAAGNERSHLHLPSPYGYYNTNSSTNWWMIYHLVNKGAVSKTVNIEIVYRYRTPASRRLRSGSTSTAVVTPSTRLRMAPRTPTSTGPPTEAAGSSALRATSTTSTSRHFRGA